MPEKKGSLTERTSEALIKLILDQQLSPGDKLPNEFELAQRLGVGRNTIREAIRQLAARNILVIRQGAGTFVAGNTGIPEDPLGLTFIGNDPHLALELSEVRMLLEPAAAERAARLASWEQIVRMEELCEQIRQSCEDNRSYLECDLKLHALIGQCCGNGILNKMMNIMSDAASVSVRVTQDRHRDVAYREHKAIVDAIKRRDGEGARYAMLAHLNTTRQDLAARIS